MCTIEKSKPSSKTPISVIIKYVLSLPVCVMELDLEL